MADYCPTHQRIYQPAYGDTARGYAAHWRPFAHEALIYAAAWLREGQYTLPVTLAPCDLCEDRSESPVDPPPKS